MNAAHRWSTTSFSSPTSAVATAAPLGGLLQRRGKLWIGLADPLPPLLA
jgi:hypothetical protein